MIVYTNSNTAKLPTIPAPTASKSWNRQIDAVSAAIRTLGPESRHRFEFTTHQTDDGRWTWKATDEDSIPEPTAFQVKINGGKKAFLTREERQQNNDIVKTADPLAPDSFVRKVALVLRTLDDDSVQLIIDELLDAPGDKQLREKIQHLTNLLQE